ncbi:hypothetical protein ITP53_18585 [Nonomuraea sp. K274]|uniref:Uncharacterized protein n=1 Tax=Nonomuraea cypriaca TaxID=1187855 RepID=A0A931ACU1_9ACTN|nr:hypothetical protein [Nonomuraea cypriaca]
MPALIMNGVAAVVGVFVLAAGVDGGSDVDAADAVAVAGAGARGRRGDPGHHRGKRQVPLPVRVLRDVRCVHDDVIDAGVDGHAKASPP